MQKIYSLFFFIILSWFATANAAIAPNTKAELPDPADIQRLSTVLDHIKNYYVTPTEDGKLLENAIRGMLGGLDPHSAYLDETEFAELKVGISGKFGGLGIEVTIEDGLIRVITPIDDTPAAKAGVLAGDLIIKLNETPVKGLSLKEAVDIMRGKPGSEIILTIIRPGESIPIVSKVIRDLINVQSIKTKFLDDDYWYIRISQFQNDTGHDLKQEIKKVLQQKRHKVKGVLVDLRNNPGGVLEASVQVSSLFLDKEKLKHDSLIVYTKGRSGSQIKEKADGKDMFHGIPLVVLVNSGSASASEIVAGALQDHKRAVIVGNPTFGKGSVQTILPLKDKRGLKLTTALYYTPSGNSIQAKGIVPDIVVDNIKVPAPKKEEPGTQFMLKESDLQGHLVNERNKKAEEKAKNDTLPLLYTDYQLHEALNILKGLSIKH